MDAGKAVLTAAAAVGLATIVFFANYFVLLHDDAFFASALGGSPEAESVLQYVRGDSPVLPAMSAAETAHLVDVRQRIAQSKRWFAALLLVEFTLLFFLFRGFASFHQAAPLVRRLAGSAVIIVVVAVTALGIAALSDFTILFSAFHHPFFTGGSWVFPSGSTLVTLFPETFFLDFFRHVALSSFLQSIAVLLLFLQQPLVRTARLLRTHHNN